MRNDRANAAASDFLTKLAERERLQREYEERQTHEGIKLYNSLRKKTLSFGALQATIPKDEYRRLVLADPALESPDAQERRRAWIKLERAGILKHYRER